MKNFKPQFSGSPNIAYELYGKLGLLDALFDLPAQAHVEVARSEQGIEIYLLEAAPVLREQLRTNDMMRVERSGNTYVVNAGDERYVLFFKPPL